MADKIFPNAKRIEEYLVKELGEETQLTEKDVMVTAGKNWITTFAIGLHKDGQYIDLYKARLDDSPARITYEDLAEIISEVKFKIDRGRPDRTKEEGERMRSQLASIKKI